MKKLKIIILTVATMATVLASCEKKQCWQCSTITTTYKNGYYQNQQTSSAAVCDMTSKEKQDYETARYRNETTGAIRVESITQCQ